MPTSRKSRFTNKKPVQGSTCVAAVVREHALDIANLGDSRAVLFRDSAAAARTVDHKPSAATERERIAACGGRWVCLSAFLFSCVCASNSQRFVFLTKHV